MGRRAAGGLGGGWVGLTTGGGTGFTSSTGLGDLKRDTLVADLGNDRYSSGRR